MVDFDHLLGQEKSDEKRNLSLLPDKVSYISLKVDVIVDDSSLSRSIVMVERLQRKYFSSNPSIDTMHSSSDVIFHDFYKGVYP